MSILNKKNLPMLALAGLAIFAVVQKQRTGKWLWEGTAGVGRRQLGRGLGEQVPLHTRRNGQMEDENIYMSQP